MDSISSATRETQAESEKLPLSDAFAREFGNNPTDLQNLQAVQSPAARLVRHHFDEVANLAQRRNGIPSFGAQPRTVSYNDLREMERLADSTLGLENHYPKGTIDAMSFRHQMWSDAIGIGAGAGAVGVARLFVPLLRGRSAAVTMGLVALGAAGGYMLGDAVGHATFDRYARNSNYLSVEIEKYSSSLGAAWERNTHIAGGAGIAGGLAAFAFTGPSRLAIGLAATGLVTYLCGGIANRLGQFSAARELAREAEIGRRIDLEWNAMSR